MFTATTRRLFLAAFIALVAVSVVSHDAGAKSVTEKFSYKLTNGDVRAFSFTPGGAGQIRANATYRGAGLVRKEITVRMKLIRPSRNPECASDSPQPATGWLCS